MPPSYGHFANSPVMAILPPGPEEASLGQSEQKITFRYFMEALGVDHSIFSKTDLGREFHDPFHEAHKFRGRHVNPGSGPQEEVWTFRSR